MTDDRRLIEDYLPIEAISKEASREKSVRKGHISTLHLWWARRPLVACRAAVYGALVPASQFVPANGPDNKKKSLGRANAAKFVTELCKYPGNPNTIKKAQEHILEAHAVRLTAELAEAAKTGKRPAWVDEFKWPKDRAKVTRADIEAGRAPRPRVLDMFAGGGAIPLEALRLGCEAYALDLNPVAYIILLCTLVYPQKYGKPDPSARGMCGASVPLAQSEPCGASVPLAETQPMSYTEILDSVGYFHPEEPLDIRERRLPHWRQRGATYFVTFRLADALPPERVKALSDEREQWLRTHKEPYSSKERREYYRLFSERVQEWLDAGAGECLLRDESVARIVAGALRHFDGQRYDLLAWVVMPNHVHVLVTPRSGFHLPDILHSWKSFTAHEIDKALGRSGQVWQHESYDHIVRSPEALSRIARYIAENPAKAGITTQFVENRLENAREVGKPEACPTVTTWGGLAEEVRYWGNWVLDRVRKEIGDLYPPIPDPQYKGKRPEIEFDRKTGRWVAKGEGKNNNLLGEEYGQADVPPGYLTPVAYLWTRTVKCKNPACGATVPLVRQTWLCKKAKRYVALKMHTARNAKRVTFKVVESDTEARLGFDPAGFSKAGNAACPFCGTVADNDYVKAEGRAGRMGTQPMAVVCTRPPACRDGRSAGRGRRGKTYISADDLPAHLLPDDDAIRKRIADLCQRTGLTVPDEPIANLPADCYDNTLGITVRPYGLTTFGHLFTPRQMLSLLAFTVAVRDFVAQASRLRLSEEHIKAVATYLGVLVNRMADKESVLARWDNTRENCQGTFGRQALPMVWDFVEPNPTTDASGGAEGALDWIVGVAEAQAGSGHPATVSRGSATALPWRDTPFDAVITDPPYYDNMPYADISDFFYVWLKRSVGHLYPEHFATAGTPKKQEAVADATRHGGDKAKAVRAYEDMMARSLAEAHRVLKPDGTLAVVYAHKTTLGWSTLVGAFRRAGFTVTEAWPLDTEMKSRLRGMDSAALASSIFLVGRKRLQAAGVGNYEEDVQPELQQIVRERVETLWDQGITGADLVIACVGAGLRAFTKYQKVEYANGEEVPAERFLAEVETVVLETILHRLSKEVGGNGNRQTSLAGVDPATRFYILWRYTYRWTELDAGEAIVFANGAHVELDGPGSLSYGSRALIEKKKGKYRLLDFKDRGEDEKLGLPDDGQPAPLIDALHRTLWLMENRRRALAEFLRESRVNREHMRLVAQALAGPALKGGQVADVSPTSELAALQELTANWRAMVEDAALTPLEREARRTGQKTFDFDKEKRT